MALVRVEPRPGFAAAAEGALVDRARHMEAAAWDELYSEHFDAIFRYCAYRIPDREAAEDVAADVFVEAVRGIGRYSYRGTPFRAWLYRIAHNLASDERRRWARTATTVLPAGDLLPPEEDFAPGVLDRETVRAALADLTDDQQQVVILRFLEGLPLADVAEVMKKPTGAIKALQHRAIVRMRKTLTGEGD